MFALKIELTLIVTDISLLLAVFFFCFVLSRIFFIIDINMIRKKCREMMMKTTQSFLHINLITKTQKKSILRIVITQIFARLAFARKNDIIWISTRSIDFIDHHICINWIDLLFLVVDVSYSTEQNTCEIQIILSTKTSRRI